jgi:hypothetical protein
MDDRETSSPLPGFPLRDEWARQQFGVPPRTARRWEAEGRIVCVRIGRVPLIDLEATSARLRERGRDLRRDPALDSD